MCRKALLHTVFIMVILLDHVGGLYAQKDTLQKSALDSFLTNQKGAVGRLAKNLIVDTTGAPKGRQKNDQLYQRYKDRVIRNISIKPLRFGVSIGDTTNVFNNWLTRQANRFHWQTKEKEIWKNLFFRENDRLSPYLLGDNERFLRDLPYLQDARIRVVPVKGSNDSVDVLVLTKDVISIGGDLHMHNTQSASVTIKEDNFYGLGDRLQLQTLYEQKRSQHIGLGAEYILRNMGGSFIDGAVGYLNFSKTINSGRAEERMGYIKFNKLLVHPYMRWTYSLEARLRATQNMYDTDSFYAAYLKYKASSVDAWGTLNTSAGQIAGKNEDNRLRTGLGLRFFSQHFSDRPLVYSHQYYYQYADMTAVLGALSIFKQNFYKVQYLYGFGRPEDIPQGVDASLILGWTVKGQRRRPYLGVDFQRFYFTASEQYFDYTLQAGSFFHKRNLEDVNIIGQVSFINHLHEINSRWKQRTLIDAEIVKQFRGLLNEPVYPDHLYGDLNLNNELVGGDFRASFRGESVFYSPWSILYFKIAPFAFGDASILRYRKDLSSKVDLSTAIGGGIRVRNESLILGTVDLRCWYFPKRNYSNDRFVIEFKTKVRFTYNQKLIRRPEFIEVN